MIEDYRGYPNIIVGDCEMSIPIQSIEESLSVSYVSSVVGKSGASFDIVTNDYGVDVSVRRIDKFKGQLIDVGVSFDCQLKATINWAVEPASIVYDMEADAYNKLVYRYKNSALPCLLVLLCLPKDERDWLTISEDELRMKKCCYYQLVNGEFTNNTSSVRIRIPRENIFSPEAVKRLIEKVRLGELV